MVATRDEILARYRRLRKISANQQSDAVNLVSDDAFFRQARAIGLAVGNTLLSDDNEVDLVYDLLLYSAPLKRARAIDRYAKSIIPAPGSDEAIMLAALQSARFSIWQVERRHEAAGLILRDIIRLEDAWLVDESFERSGKPGHAFAARLARPDAFSMTCGIIVPVDQDILEDVFFELPGRLRNGPGDALAADRRFAAAIYRVAVATGVMDQVSFQPIGEAAA